MRSRLLSALALASAAAAAALPARASALTWGGSVGAQYSRHDAWTNEGRLATPYLDVNVALSLDGFVYRPGVFSYGVAAGYGRASETRPGDTARVRDHLQYSGRATLFGDRRTPFSVSAYAVRATEDAHPTALSPNGLDVATLSYGVSAIYRQPARPSLSASYSRSESTSHTPLLPAASREIDTLAVATSYGAPGFSYNATYRTDWSEGTYVADVSNDHRVTLFARASASDNLEARVSDSYSLRIPREKSPFSPRQEFNSLTATLTRTGGGRDTDQIAYAHSRGVQVAEGFADLDRTSQSIRYTAQRGLSNPEWRVSGAFGASLAQNRVGAEEHRDAGQDLGVVVGWLRNLPASGQVELRGGPTVALVEPDGAGVEWGYGASAGGSYRRTVRLTTYEGGYDVTFASDVGNLGTSLLQSARGSATSPIGTGSLRGGLTLTAMRRDSPRVGAAAHRSATLDGAYTWHRLSVTAQAGVTSGVSNPVTDAGVSDGLILSLPYDTHTYVGMLASSYGVTERLRLGASGRFSSSSLPDRPDLEEREGRGSIGYVVGAFAVRLEDRYTVSRVPGGTARRNLLYISVNRAFGSRY